jgi:macrolide phosphotransferase
MARSPFTLAASVTSALPRVGVIGVAALTEGTGGRYDSALVDLDDGRRVVVRVATDDAAAADLVAEARVLRALTPGVRGLLPFRAPELLGELSLDGMRGVVVDHLDGYRVDAAHVPAGRGAATGIGTAIAAVHSLPSTVLRTEGLPAMSPEQVRADVSRLLDRVAAIHRIPVSLLSRWSRAVAVDRLWQFESTVVLGGASPDAFLFTDVAEVPRVVGLLDWHGLSVGDPAVDLRWLASAPAAAADVYAAYAAEGLRAPDGQLRTRARLYAELEFARWLVHGDDEGREDIMTDALSLLQALAEGVVDDDLLADDDIDIDDALALLDRGPQAPARGIDTSMQTDAYGADDVSLFTDAPEESGSLDPRDRAGATPDEGEETAPIELSEWVGAHEDDPEDRDEARRASDAALRRWAASE